MTTIRAQVLEALKETGEKPENLRCFVQLCHEQAGEYHYGEGCDPPIEVPFKELPSRSYDPSYGGVEGPPFIAFSEKYVYIQGEYDGSEWIEPIPRHVKYIGKTLPSVGG